MSGDHRSFGNLLRAARHRRGLSQLALAGVASVSTRHLSFIECGRARPGYATAGRLIEAVGASGHEADALFAAAGIALSARFARAPSAPADGLTAPPMAVMTADGSLLACNDALTRALALVDDLERRWACTCGDAARNLLVLSFHPDGLAPFMENHDEIARLTLAPLVARARAEPAAARTLARLRRFPRVHKALAAGVPETQSPQPVPEIYRYGARRLRFTSLYLPLDAQRVQALFVPADIETHRLLAASASAR